MAFNIHAPVQDSDDVQIGSPASCGIASESDPAELQFEGNNVPVEEGPQLVSLNTPEQKADVQIEGNRGSADDAQIRNQYPPEQKADVQDTDDFVSPAPSVAGFIDFMNKEIRPEITDGKIVFAEQGVTVSSGRVVYNADGEYDHLDKSVSYGESLAYSSSKIGLTVSGDAKKDPNQSEITYINSAHASQAVVVDLVTEAYGIQLELGKFRTPKSSSSSNVHGPERAMLLFYKVGYDDGGKESAQLVDSILLESSTQSQAEDTYIMLGATMGANGALDRDCSGSGMNLLKALDGGGYFNGFNRVVIAAALYDDPNPDPTHAEENSSFVINSINFLPESSTPIPYDANDSLNGGDGKDVLYGYDGKDTLDGGAGNDTLDGGAGNDFLDGGDGEDKLYGDAGNDIMVYDANDALVEGGSGIDFLLTAGNESLDALLGSGKVTNVEVLVKGSGVEDLTNMKKSLADYGIGLNDDNDRLTLTNTNGQWTQQDANTYVHEGANGTDLTLQIAEGANQGQESTTDNQMTVAIAELNNNQ